VIRHAVIDWRERGSQVLSDFHDGDRHLIVGDGQAGVCDSRGDVLIPHPLPGVRYADGVAS
jgi:hypothetical protein